MGYDQEEEAIIRKATVYDLHRLITSLKQEGPGLFSERNIAALTDENLGLVYVASVMSMPKRNFISTFPGCSENTARMIKKRFQEQNRADFYRLLLQLTQQDQEFKDLKETYRQAAASQPQTNPQPNTIENLLAPENCPPHKTVGAAVCRGAQKYFQEKIHEVAPETKYKLFLEHHHILIELQKL